MVQNVRRRPLSVVVRFQSLTNAIFCEEVALGRGFQPAIRFPCQHCPANVTHFHLSVTDRL
jgi:hypothetical protein